MGNILIYHKISEHHLEHLKEKFPDFNFIACTSIGEMEKHIENAEVLVSFKCTDEMLDRGNKLQWVQALSAGVDSFPLDEIKKRGIILTNGRGIHKIHMSEYAIGAMIMLARSFYLMYRNQINKKWDRKIQNGEIYGSTLGILGLGSIGKEIAKKAEFMGMKVIGVKENPSFTEHVEKVYTSADMAEVFKLSDYIINLLPSTAQTDKIIDNKYFNIMKPGACFINMGRGRTVNEQDFIEALKSGKMRAAISDVFYAEPLPEDSPLWDLDNIFITPHICGESDKYFDRALEIIDNNLMAFKGEGDYINLVNIDKGY
ncbi:MAG: D-2-hydroxyacid dehydrogenase [Lutispora sp.]|nr:D-2-hydroxyacid dehydrogenase [Lutispora sp.]